MGYVVKGLGALAAIGVAVLSCAASPPRIGVTVALRNSTWMPYLSDSFFKERPIAVELAKSGLDPCWYIGWGKDDAPASLRQFNALWLMTDHEEECPYSAEETAAALKSYVEAGGGLVFCFSPGRYPEAPVDAYWTQVMKAFGAEILHEEVSNPEMTVQVDKVRRMFHTDSLVPHPVTKGVKGLWLADRSGGTWGSAAVKYSPEWDVVVTGGKGARSVPKNPRTNNLEPDKQGFYSSDVPIVAVRPLGRGRIVFIASHKDTCGWMFNIDKWPNFTERSNYDGKPCDMVTLLENALAWAVEPSMADASFAKDYKPYAKDIPPYEPQPDFGLREREKPSYPKDFAPADRPRGARGIIGVRSSHSDGASSVADYVAAAKAAGLNFLVFCDPLESMDADKLAALREDCQRNSSVDFYCCPGVEYVDSSGIEWALWHDKVEFPDPEPFKKDGRTYTMFDGRRILQRNAYAHQNLYRGVPLNMKRIGEIGNDIINLAYFNTVAPKVFDVETLVHDNAPEWLKTGHALFRAATVSYTRVRRAEDVALAAKTAATCGDSLEAVSAWANAKGGWGGNESAGRAHLQAVYGAGIEIADFDAVRASGTDIWRVALGVSCPAGVGEVEVRDGDRRVLARFDAKGEKLFKATFDFLHDRQSVIFLVAHGLDGSEAISNAKWIYYYHAGMFRCGDNSNLLSQNPPCIVFLNWDDALVPPFKVITLPPKHYHCSEAVLWEAYDKASSREPSAWCDGKYSRVRLKGVDYPSEAVGLPSSHTRSTLNQPNVVSIFDQDLGEFIMEPSRSETSATYGLCSPVKKISEGRHWRRHHRVYQFVDRHDGWWRAIYQEESPYYRGGYTIVEGEIDFTEDAELSAPIDLVTIGAENPSGKTDVFSREADRFTKGSYYALHSTDKAWHGLFGLEGSDELHVDASPKGAGIQAVLRLGAAGQKVTAGETLRYRFAVGSFVEPPRNAQYCEWFARMMDGAGFNHGDAPVSGIVELAAKGNVAECEFGPTWFIQNYPVRIKGLADNGCAMMTDGDNIWRPLAFDGETAYGAVPLELRRRWKFMNLYVADNPSLRLTYTPALPGHEIATLQVQNMSDAEVVAHIRDLRTGKTFDLHIPARAMVVREE